MLTMVSTLLTVLTVMETTMAVPAIAVLQAAMPLVEAPPVTLATARLFEPQLTVQRPVQLPVMSELTSLQ